MVNNKTVVEGEVVEWLVCVLEGWLGLTFFGDWLGLCWLLVSTLEFLASLGFVLFGFFVFFFLLYLLMCFYLLN